MQIKGRRVGLLLMGVLPLLAKDDIPETYGDVETLDDNEYMVEPHENAAEKMYDDALTSIPSLRFLDFGSPSSANFVMVDGDHIDRNVDFREWNSSDQITPNIEPTVLAESVAIESEIFSDSTSEQDNSLDTRPSEEKHLEERERTITDTAIDEDETLVDDAEPEPQKEPEPDPDNEDKSQKQAESEDEEEGSAKRVMVDYANKSAGALILERSPSMKGASNLLTSDKDKYAISPCKDKKFVVVGLSEDILVKQIKLSNYELYSSHVKDFQVLGSQTMGQWVDLGTFTASHGNGEQSFDLAEPSWARYLKFRFISHHHNEHFCTLSQIQVHGSTMLQGFREQWQEGEDDEPEQNMDSPDDEVTSNHEIVNATSTTDHEPSLEAMRELEPLGYKSDVAEESDQSEDSDKASIRLEQIPVADNHETHQRVLHGNTHLDESSELGKTDSMFDLQSLPLPHALQFVRFDLAAAKIVNVNTQTSQQTPRLPARGFGSFAIHRDFGSAAQHAVKMVVTEASNTVQMVGASSTVSSAVQEIQNRIQTTIGKSWELQHTIQTFIGKALPRLKPDWALALGSANCKLDSCSEIASSLEDVPPGNHNASVALTEDESPEQNRSVGEIVPTAVETIETDKIISRNPSNDDAVHGGDMSESLAKVISRYPSAKCLESLHFPSFKKNIIAKAAAKAASGGSTNNHVGKLEPIFKTLTDEIKTLQISQSVHDQFSRALMSCYQSIMIEMVSDIHASQVIHEERLARLEAEVKKQNSKGWLAELPSGAIFFLSFFLSIFFLAYAQTYSILKDLSSQLFEFKHELEFVGLTILLSSAMIAVWTWHRWSRKHRFSPPPSPHPMRQSPETGLEAKQIRDLRHLPSTPSERVSLTAFQPRTIPTISKSRSLQLFPAE